MSSAAASSTWLTDYLSALSARDVQEQALKSAYDAYSKLADRTASQVSSAVLQPAPETPPAPPPPITSVRSRFALPGSASSPPPVEQATIISSLRADLTAAQSSKHQLTAQLAALTTQYTTLQSTLVATTARLQTLEASHASLTRKLRDREDEIKRKKELLERVQDELLAAEMQVNIAEGDRKRVEEENRELVGRLVGAKELEVDKMNRMGGWE